MIWIIIIAMVLFSAVFSGLEIAYISSNKLEIEISNKKGGLINSILSKFIQTPSNFLATLLIGNNLALVIYGIYFEKILQGTLDEFISNGFLIVLIQTIISTVIILILAEYLPKSLFRIQPNKMLKIFALPMFVMYWFMKGVVQLFVWIAKGVIRIFFKLKVEEVKPIFGRIELENFIQQRTSGVESLNEVETEIQIYKNVLDFSQVKARDCMVPRTEIICADLKTDIKDLTKLFTETGLSKILIYSDSIDEIIGFVHSSELFKNPEHIKDILLPVGFVPETISAQDSLNNFISQHKSIFIVVDEFGGTSGMLTIEDIMEEIFGDIEDEHDILDRIEEQISDFEYQFSGRFEIEYLNEKYGFKLPLSEDYTTISGLIFTSLDRIAEEGETLIIGNYSFLIDKVGDTRTELVKLFINPIEE